MNKTTGPAAAAAEWAARESYGRLLAFLLARGTSLAAAEDALGDAFAAALQTWPEQGLPTRPEAWLLTTARNRLTDAARRRRTQRGATPELLHRATLPADPPATFPDDRLGLLLVCAAPEVEPSARGPSGEIGGRFGEDHHHLHRMASFRHDRVVASVG